jgi:hypothetical protein
MCRFGRPEKSFVTPTPEGSVVQLSIVANGRVRLKVSVPKTRPFDA